MITDVINPLLQWLNNHPNWAGLATFLISAGESVAILGTLVPGTIMMTAIGALAGAGVIPLWPTIISAILGAIVGDGISYLIGHHFKARIRQMWPFRNNPSWLERGETFFHKHGGKSVFIGRFVGPVRALIPLIAGMLNMKPLRFYIANILSAIGWAPIYMLPGILLGAVSLELPPDLAVHVILVLLLFVLFIMFCIWFITKFFALIGYQIDQTLNQIWHKLHSSRFFNFITIALKHHDKNKPHGQLVLAFYFILVTASFLLLANIIKQNGSGSLDINNIMFHLFRSLRTPSVDTAMIYITLLGEKLFLVPMIAVLFGVLVYNKRSYLAFHLVALGLLTIGSIEVIKQYVHSVRPWGVEILPSGYSFPSGHSTLASTFYVGFALLLSLAYPNKRKVLLFSSIVIAFFVSISRLYLGVHWFTDIFSGWLLSAALLLFVTISYNRKQDRQNKINKLIVTMALSFILFYAAVSFHDFSRFKQDYTLKNYPTHTVPMEKWWQLSDDNVPVYRIGRFGVAEQLFNLQWVGNLNEIQQTLLDNKWEVPPDRDWISILQRITDVGSYEHLPLVSPLFLEKKPVLILIKHTDNKKNVLVLRLWDSNIVIAPAKEHLWVGTVSIIPRTYNWIFKKKSNEIKINISLLFEKNQKKFDLNRITLPPQRTHRKFTTQPVILLIKPKA